MKRLYRSRNDRMIAGVAGGLAEYFGVDSTIVRLLWVLLLLPGGLPGLIPYIICWIIMPEEPETVSAVRQAGTMAEPPTTSLPSGTPGGAVTTTETSASPSTATTPRPDTATTESPRDETGRV